MASYIDLNNLGSFANIEALWSAYPEGGQEGDYCTIDGVKYRWDKYDRMWVADPNFGPTPARSVTTFDGDVNMQNNLTVAGYLRAKGIKQPCLGLYLTEAALKAKWPKPEVGMWAIVDDELPGIVYVCESDGVWTETTITAGPDDVDLSSITINGIRNWVSIDSLSELPVDPTEDEQGKGYLLDTKLYVYVGEGSGDSDTPGQQYKGVEITGPVGPGGVGFASVAAHEPVDGAMDITLTNGDVLTVDLKHTHENMARLVAVDDESELPSTLESDTIYVVIESGAITKLIIAGVEFTSGS